jgi:hypothetical protein
MCAYMYTFITVYNCTVFRKKKYSNYTYYTQTLRIMSPAYQVGQVIFRRRLAVLQLEINLSGIEIFC